MAGGVRQPPSGNARRDVNEPIKNEPCPEIFEIRPELFLVVNIGWSKDNLRDFRVDAKTKSTEKHY